MNVTNHSLKVFVESLGGKFWVCEPKSVARAYFGESFRQPYVQFELDANGQVDLIEGNHISAYIRTKGNASPQWLASQKKLATEEYKAQLLAVVGFVQIEGLNEGVEVNLQNHSEEWHEVGEGLCVALTDGATIAGVPVGSDGVHLVKDGKLWRPAAGDSIDEVNFKVMPVLEQQEPGVSMCMGA